MKVAARMTAVVAAMFLVAGCGSRLSDTTIEHAASKVVVPAGVFANTPAADPTGPAGTQARIPAAGSNAPLAPAGGTTAATGANASGGPGPAARPSGAAQAARPTPNAQPQQAPQAVGSRGQAQPEPSGASGASAALPADGTLSTVVIGNVGDYSGIVGSVLKEGAPM